MQTFHPTERNCPAISMLSPMLPSPLPLMMIQLVVFFAVSKNQVLSVAPSLVVTFSSLYCMPYLSGFTLYSREGFKAKTEEAHRALTKSRIENCFIFLMSD